ncbi:MAG: hypothetical protein U9Q23_04350 [Candidatus Bipolaricaulota bacterium]|nr:hypothetical protein [Candidatus Bipolaricaulota bacterium]
MELPFWSDKDHLFIAWALGITINFKFIAKKLGLVKTVSQSVLKEDIPQSGPPLRSHKDRLREQIEDSKYEEMK